MTMKVQVVDELGKVIDEVSAEVSECNIGGNGKSARLDVSFARKVEVKDGYRAVMFAEQVTIAAQLPAAPAPAPAPTPPAPTPVAPEETSKKK